MQNTQRILSRPSVEAMVPYSRSHISRLEKAGRFPKRVRLGPNRIGWLKSEIDQWIEERAKERFNG